MANKLIDLYFIKAKSNVFVFKTQQDTSKVTTIQDLINLSPIGRMYLVPVLNKETNQSEDWCRRLKKQVVFNNEEWVPMNRSEDPGRKLATLMSIPQNHWIDITSQIVENNSNTSVSI